MSAHAFPTSSSALPSSVTTPNSWTTSSPVSYPQSTWTYTGARVPAWANAPNTPSASTPTSAVSAPSSAPTSVRKSTSSSSDPPDGSQRRGRKRKLRTQEELSIMKGTAGRFSSRLADDRNATLKPDIDTPFKDTADVVKRLLPYHIWQHVNEDDIPRSSAKGKTKVTEEENIIQEIQETKFAIKCTKRFHALESKFREVAIRTGKRSAPDEMLYALEQAMIEAERNDVAAVSQELREARTELERVEREQKIHDAQAAIQARATPVQQQYKPQPQPTSKPQPQPQHPTPTPPPPISTQLLQPVKPLQSIQQQHPYHQQVAYNAYYAQAQQAYANRQSSSGVAAPLQTAPTTPASMASTPAPQGSVSTATSAPAAGTSAAAATAVANGGAIPVQLPATTLPALARLGLVPVPASTLQPGAPRPACVLMGALRGGTLLALEVNVGMLQSTQMNGLALLLSSMMTSRGDGAATAAAAPAAGSVAAASSAVVVPNGSGVAAGVPASVGVNQTTQGTSSAPALAMDASQATGGAINAHMGVPGQTQEGAPKAPPV